MMQTGDVVRVTNNPKAGLLLVEEMKELSDGSLWYHMKYIRKNGQRDRRFAVGGFTGGGTREQIASRYTVVQRGILSRSSNGTLSAEDYKHMQQVVEKTISELESNTSPSS